MVRLPYLLFIVAITLIGTTPASAQDAFRGRDDRVKLDTVSPPYAAIGRLNLGGGKQFCTGVLIAPDKVVTAAHCLVDRRTRRPYLPKRVHFVAGQRRNKYLDHAPARCVRYIRGRTIDGIAEIKQFRDDAAIVILTKSLKVKPARLAAPYFADPGALMHPAYAKDRPYLLSVHRGCRVLDKAHGVWLTDCDTNYGSSGGPLLREDEDGLAVVAIMSGAARRGEGVVSVAVPLTIWSRLAKTATCDGQS